MPVEKRHPPRPTLLPPPSPHLIWQQAARGERCCLWLYDGELWGCTVCKGCRGRSQLTVLGSQVQLLAKGQRMFHIYELPCSGIHLFGAIKHVALETPFILAKVGKKRQRPVLVPTLLLSPTPATLNREAQLLSLL